MSRQVNKWGKAAHSIQTNAALQEKITKARIKRAAKEGQGKAVLEVGSSQANLAFWQQGDAAMQTDEAIEARATMRKNPEVTAVLQLFWETAQRSMQQARRSDEVAHMLSKEEYLLISRKLSKAMLEEWDEAAAQELALEDWESDRRGNEMMSREHFMDCIFELADMWTRTGRPRFLSTLRCLARHVLRPSAAPLGPRARSQLQRAPSSSDRPRRSSLPSTSPF